jgi:adenylate cyclase
MSRSAKAFIVGLITAILGGFFSITAGQSLETRVGLDMLFRLRGPREVPPEAVVVTLDPDIANPLNLPKEPRKWPRSIYAKIVDNLTQAGVAIIVFDLQMDEPRDANEDAIFAESVRRAGNVLLYEHVIKPPVKDDRGRYLPQVPLEKRFPPLPVLTEGALGFGTFFLPEREKIFEYWTFKSGSGDRPTLPALVFQAFALEVYEDLVRLMTETGLSQVISYPEKNSIITGKKLLDFTQNLRHFFFNHSDAAEQMLKAVKQSPSLASDPRKQRMLRSLIRMYTDEEGRYFNFYGKPGTVPTVSYDQGMRGTEALTYDDREVTFKGRAVFVGVSELYQSNQLDGFPSVFSRDDGVDLCGVELLATAFANFLEDMPVRFIPGGWHLALILMWGALLGILCRFLSISIGAGAVLGVSALYLSLIYYQFKETGVCYPVVTPLFLQAPFAFFFTTLWKYQDTRIERGKIKEAFGFYVPPNLVEELARNVANIKETRKMVYGICMFTDVKGFTKVSESMNPMELARVMNLYYESILKPIRQHQGLVLKLWAMRSWRCGVRLRPIRR